MTRKITFIALAFAFLAGGIKGHAQTALPVMKASETYVDYFEDGAKSAWIISPEVRPDVLNTCARHVTFCSKTDTLSFTLNEGDVYDFVILNAAGDSAYTRVKWVTNNPLQNPPKEMLGLSPTGRMSRHQAVFDINALVYTLNEVHPNMYAQVGMEDFMQHVERAKASLPDSLTRVELYERVAPLVAMLGDGHTTMLFPYNDLFTKSLKRLPLSLKATGKRQIMIAGSADAQIPDSVELLSINNVSAEALIDKMLPYISGEREFFRLNCLTNLFPALFEMLYAAPEYDVEFLVGKKRKHVTVPAMTISEINAAAKAKYSAVARQNSKPRNTQPYYYEVSHDGKYALLTFNACTDFERMAAFADSMVAVLNDKKVKNLIIDVRANGGGNSRVGDELLRRLSPVPFNQYGGTYARVTPTTIQLARQKGEVGIAFYDNTRLIEPLPPEKRFSGKMFLLTSHSTFSSASSFSWAFRRFDMGTVVGEETGGMNVSFGDYLRYSLPVSGLLTSVSFKRFWLYGADERNIHGTLPHYDVPADEALNFVKKKIKAK